MNALLLLSPKSEVRFLTDTQTLRQGLELMRLNGYTALPVITKDGLYVGTVTEGDFLWYLYELNADESVVLTCENERIKNIIRPEFTPAVTADVDMPTLIDRAMKQNFVPVTDDKGSFIGIVTRQSIIRMLRDEREKGNV